MFPAPAAFYRWLEMVSYRLWLRTGRWLADIGYNERSLYLFWRCDVDADQAAAGLEWRAPRTVAALTDETISRSRGWWTTDQQLATLRSELFDKLNLVERKSA